MKQKNHSRMIIPGLFMAALLAAWLRPARGADGVWDRGAFELAE
jgi:hypothetical protein